MIGIFDSGIGGVTVLRELLKFLPNENYLYYSDSKNLPYGDKSKEELIKICDSVVEYLINRGSKIIVIACNTASSICKEYLRNKYKIPIVAIEPAYKMVYDLSYQNKTIVMATKDTINSENFIKLYEKYNNDNTSICECSGLADLIEEGNKQKIKEYLKEHIGKYKEVKNVVLGCTHYPLIKEEIKEILGPVNFYDGSIGVSKQVKKILTENNMLSKSKNGSIEFFDSNNNQNKKNTFFKIINRGEK